MAAPSADVFLPGAGGAARGSGKILGLSRPVFALALAGGLLVGYLIYRRLKASPSAPSVPGPSAGAPQTPIDTSGLGGGLPALPPAQPNVDPLASPNPYSGVLSGYSQLVQDLLAAQTPPATSGQPGNGSQVTEQPPAPAGPTEPTGPFATLGPAFGGQLQPSITVGGGPIQFRPPNPGPGPSGQSFGFVPTAAFTSGGVLSGLPLGPGNYPTSFVDVTGHIVSPLGRTSGKGGSRVGGAVLT